MGATVHLHAAGHCGIKEIDGAKEISHKAIERKFVDFQWCAYLHKASRIHNCHTGGQCHGFLLIMGNHNKCGAQFVLEIDQFKLSLLAELLIQCCQRFIQQ